MDAHIRRSVRSDTEVVLHGVKPGTYPGNYPGTDIAHSALYTLHASQWITQALKASDEGFDAYAMCSLPNPYIREIRSMVDMPVVGYGEASFHLSCMLGHRFGLMVFIAPMAQLYSEQIDLYGLKSRCAGVKPVGFTFHDVLKNWDNPGPLIDRFKASAADLIAAGADVIIPGEMPLNILLASNGVTAQPEPPRLAGRPTVARARQPGARFLWFENLNRCWLEAGHGIAQANRHS
jgi:hypothetical protein